MTVRRSGGPLALLAVAAIAIAACGPAATPTPTQAGAATQGPDATSGGLPTLGGLPSFAIPSFNADQELEAMLPDEVGGETVTAISMTGDTLMGTGQGSPELQAVLDQFDKQPADLSVAIGGAGEVGIFAYRIRGVDANQFFQSFLVAASADDPRVSVADANLGGKAVKRVVTADETLYLYAKGDVLFGVGGDVSDELIGEALSKLP